MKLKKNFKDDIFKANSFDKPWGKHITFAMNEKCSVKLLEVKKDQGISLQWHRKRHQFYYILDEGFEIWHDSNNVKPRKYIAKIGDMFGFKSTVIHRAIYKGDKKFGRYLEVSFGEYNETDIIRLDDMYGRM